MKRNSIIAIASTLIVLSSCASADRVVWTQSNLGIVEILFLIIGVILLVVAFNILSELKEILFQIKEKNKTTNNMASNGNSQYSSLPQQPIQQQPQNNQPQPSSTTRCPECGSVIPVGVNSCPRCGCPLS